jgi:hypothetical protein
MTSDDPQTALRVQQEIRLAEDDIVSAIQHALDNKQHSPQTDQLEESQFRNLLRGSDSTASVEAIKNFLRYQVGRGGEDGAWGLGQNSLAEQIVYDIDNLLYKKAGEIANKTNSNWHNDIWLNLIRRYLGYGARHLKYRSVLKGK